MGNFFGRKFTGGRGLRRKPGEMNKLEAKYSQHLNEQQKRGEVLWFKFEAMTFKLAPDTRYTPDFAVLMPDGTVELHEIKGRTKNKKTGTYSAYCEGDAKLKIKIASAMFPFRFIMLFQEKSGEWNRHEFIEKIPYPLPESLEKPGMVAMRLD